MQTTVRQVLASMSLISLLIVACSTIPEPSLLPVSPLSPLSAVAPSAVPPLPIEEATSLPDTPLPLASVTASHLITQTVWATYVFSSGVSVDYPSTLVVQPQARNSPISPESVWLVPTVESLGQYSVEVLVYGRPHRDRDIANPFTWSPNEGGYEVRWAKPITVTDAQGYTFLWGNDDRPQFLYSIYYSDRYELDVRLYSYVPESVVDRYASQGYTDTIESEFAVYERIRDSIRFKR